jgi:hypothetical protein
MRVVEGTLALGWPSEVGAALVALGHDAVVSDDASDPFTVLLERVDRIRANPDCVIVCSRVDVEHHPDIDALLRDLASVFLSGMPHPTTFVLDADPQEFFMRCIAEGLTRAPRRCEYLGGKVLKRICAPAYIVDTPGLFRNFVCHGLSSRAGALDADMEQADGVREDEDGGRDVSRP